MKYTRLAVVAVVFVAIILWLRQCTSSDSGDISLTPAQIQSLKQGQTDGIVPTAAPTQTQKPASGS